MRRFIYGAAGLLGIFLLSHSVYLVTVRVTHSGVLLPALFGAGLLAWSVLQAWFFQPWQAWWAAHPRLDRLSRWAAVGAWLWLASVLLYFAVLQSLGTERSPGPAPRAIVVLGSSTPGGKASPALTERLKTAYRVAQEEPQALVVVSGGVDFRQVLSEAFVMGRDLQAMGLPAARLVLEDRSTSTYENLVFSARVLQARDVTQDQAILIVTSDFHTLRAGWIANKAGWSQARTVVPRHRSICATTHGCGNTWLVCRGGQAKSPKAFNCHCPGQSPPAFA